MKFPRYVYKRLNGQEYHYGVGDSFLEEMKEKTHQLALVVIRKYLRKFKHIKVKS